MGLFSSDDPADPTGVYAFGDWIRSLAPDAFDAVQNWLTSGGVAAASGGLWDSMSAGLDAIGWRPPSLTFGKRYGPDESPNPPKPDYLFWAVVAAAVLLVLFVLIRIL